MYLKRVYARDGYHYILSESCYDDECWKHRPLIDLGPDPGTYIEYPGGNSFHVKESLLERVQGMAERFSEDELEALLMPFLDPHIRRDLDLGDVRQIISYSKAFSSFPSIVQSSMLVYTSFVWHINL